MALEQKIAADLKEAMKAKDQTKLDVLRMVKTAMTNFQIEKKSEQLNDSDLLGILQKQAKQRRESIASYQNAGRPELAEKEKRELTILESYLPSQLSDEELNDLIRKAITNANAQSKADVGRVMKTLMPTVKGRADGKRVQQAVLALLT